MNNKEICDYVQTVDLHNIRKTYISELCVREGFGQSCGGYLEPGKEYLSQKEHFLNYYGGRDYCRELLMQRRRRLRKERGKLWM